MTLPVTLNSRVMDGTPDADGDIFVVSDIEGWEGADVQFDVQQRNDSGATLVTNRLKERPMNIVGSAYPRVNSPNAVFRIRSKIEAMASFYSLATLLTVNEPSPGVAKRCGVYRSGKLHMPPPKYNVQEFELPVTAPDPRKYAVTPTVVGLTNTTANLVNLGNFTTYIVAVTTNTTQFPFLRNNTYSTAQSLSLAKPAGESVVPGTVVNFQGRFISDPSGVGRDWAVLPNGRLWWPLLPGTNNVTVQGGWQITYSSAWV